MKKLLSIALISAIGVTVLTSCSENTTDSKNENPVEIAKPTQQNIQDINAEIKQLGDANGINLKRQAGWSKSCEYDKSFYAFLDAKKESYSVLKEFSNDVILDVLNQDNEKYIDEAKSDLNNCDGMKNFIEKRT